MVKCDECGKVIKRGGYTVTWESVSSDKYEGDWVVIYPAIVHFGSGEEHFCSTKCAAKDAKETLPKLKRGKVYA